MNITMKRDLNQTSMIISGQEGAEPEADALQMVLQNQIPGLLPMETECINGQLRLVCHVSSRTMMSEMMESGSICREHLNGLIRSAGKCMGHLREYLLDPGQLMLREDCIFSDAKKQNWEFCFNPFYSGNQQEDLRGLFERIIACIDYEDQELVRMAYEMYMTAQAENMSWKELEQILDREEPSREVLFRDFFSEMDSKLREQEAEAGDGSGSRILAVSGEETPYPERADAAPEPWNETANGTGAGRAEGFVRKLKEYLKGKRLRDIMADIDDGVILQKIRQEKGLEPDLFPGFSRIGEKEETQRKLVSAGKGEREEVELDRYPFSIGKLDGRSDLLLYHPAVSRDHACIYRERDDYLIEDHRSRNGTYVNGIRIRPHVKTPIHPGDHIRLAAQEFIFQ